ncbi:MAG TPA: hypothetical protein VI389_02910 [Geobacteraceae bacterium]
MHEAIRPEWFIIIVMLVPCIIGGVFAYHRGRSVIGWGVLSALFPIFLLVIYFNKPLREVRGGFKRCSACGEFIKWKSATCKYCGTAQPNS